MEEEEDYYKELAFLQASKDIEDWQQWEEELKQKPAKITIVKEYDKSTVNT